VRDEVTANKCYLQWLLRRRVVDVAAEVLRVADRVAAQVRASVRSLLAQASPSPCPKSFEEREKELNECEVRLHECSLASTKGFSIDRAWIDSRLQDLRTVFTVDGAPVERIRQELSNLLVGKIILVPMTSSAKPYYKAVGKTRPGKLLAGLPVQYSVIALRGFEPRLSG
jgi:hypothetical protein